jgi:outer membrane protein OmpA-like peptidoglycan-associated protein
MLTLGSALRAAVYALVVTAALCGCAAPAAPPPPPGPKTTVVLLPDEEGHVGAVIVSTAGGAQRVNAAFSEVVVDAGTSPPSQPVERGKEAVDSSFRTLLDAQPPRPAAFILHFRLGTSTLTDESKAQLPALLLAAHERKPTEITVFGHADAIGPERRNVRLSAERAQTVAKLLRKSDSNLGSIDVQSFGDKVPLFPSKPGVPEPRNRRVEVQIL